MHHKVWWIFKAKIIKGKTMYLPNAQSTIEHQAEHGLITQFVNLSKDGSDIFIVTIARQWIGLAKSVLG
jgi:hypothetical protein